MVLILDVQYDAELTLFCLCQVSYLWEEIPWLQQCLSPTQSSCSCTLQTRLKMLQAVSQLQVGSSGSSLSVTATVVVSLIYASQSVIPL